MRLLRLHMERAFAERLTFTIAALFSHDGAATNGTQSPVDYRVFLDEAIERVGIEQNSDIAAFVILEMAARDGAGADGFLDWSQDIIMSDALAGPTKMALIESRLKQKAAEHSRAALLNAMLAAVRAGG